MDDRSMADVLKDAISNIQDIIRAEVRLAKTEVREESQKAGRSVAMFAGGAVAAFYALNFVLFCLVFALALVLPLWLSALLVGAVLFIVAAVLVSMGRDRWKEVHAKPQQTIDTVKENVEWAKQQTR
ncbi:MAG: phage holin family protein [Bryobacteraceae bacterium]|nr:phage holin family protein [Bryobacteraceae bacterium]